MRTLICAAASLGAVALSVSTAMAAEQPERPKAQAISADRLGVQASYRGPTVGHGYTAQARRIADCLATYPNYDPKSDRIRVSPGVTRRCFL